MSTETGTSPNESNDCSVNLVVPETTVTLVTVIIGTVVGLTFLFGFGNALALGLRLGVPIWVAPFRARRTRRSRNYESRRGPGPRS